MRFIAIKMHRAEGSWQVFLLVCNTRCCQFQRSLLQRSPLGPQPFLGLFSVLGRSKLFVILEVSKLAIVEVDFLMQITQEVLVASGSRLCPLNRLCLCS